MDILVFRFLNGTLTHPAADWFFPFVTEIRNFHIVYAAAAVAVMIKTGKRGVIFVLLLALVITAGDQLSSFVIKPLVGRIRPCTALDHVRLLVGCGGGKSFPSSHAVNNFAAAFLVSRFYPKSRRYIYTWAFLVVYSRVYVGVHYPSDLVGGALLGTGIAWMIVSIYERAVVPRVKLLQGKG
jgi:undecaprenyl-diphosphatase